MLKEIITQVDSQCGNCGDELPKGSKAFIKNYYNESYCVSCIDKKIGNDE
jgi:hypothetical protein